MNRKLLLTAAIAAVALGAACVVLFQQLNSTRHRERAAASAAQAESAARALNEERLQSAEKERTRVEKQNKELADLAHNLRQSEAQQASNVTALAQRLKGTNAGALGADADAGKGMGDMMSKMMKDPAMKEMIRSQQKSMMKMMYGSLFKDLNLSADDQKKLTDLMIDAQMGGVENMGELLGKDETARTNAVNAVAEKQKKLNEDIKALLGEEKFAQYESYQKSVGDRMVLSQFQQQLGDTPLRDEQMKQLLQAMADERGKVPPIISEDPSKTADSLAKLANEEMLNQQFKWQEDFNKRVLDRAGQVLTPEQLKEFTEFQESQLNMQKFGLKMAREMFGGDKGGTAPSVK